MNLKHLLTSIFPGKKDKAPTPAPQEFIPEKNMEAIEKSEVIENIATAFETPIEPKKETPKFPNPKAYVNGVAKDGSPRYTDKYTEAQKLFIVQCIGQMMSPSELGEAFKDEYDIELTHPSTLMQVYKRTAKWKLLIDKTRTDYIQKMNEIAGSHKTVRLARADKVYEKAIKKGDLKNSLSAIDLQRKEMEGDGSVSITMNQYNILTDEELQERQKQVMEKIKFLSEKGQPSESTTKTITIGA